MKVLILGAAGQVGSELGPALQRTSHDHGGHGVEIITKTRDTLDVTDFDALSQTLSDLKPSWVINATAYTAVDRAESEPDLAELLNSTVPHYLAKLCQAQAARLIHISTDYVFPGQGDLPFDETAVTEPLGVYGKTKLRGEQAIRDALQAHIILRTSWVFGERGTNFVKTMLRLAGSRNQISVVADQIGAPTSARSIAETIASIVFAMQGAEETDTRWGTYHYSGYPFCSWSGFAQEIFAQALELGLMTAAPQVHSITTEEYPTPAKRPHNSRLDCGKLRTIFEVEPDDWKDSLTAVLSGLKSAEDK